MVSGMTANSKISVSGSQYSRERLGEIPAMQRFAQHLIHTDFGRAVRELGTTVAAHQDDRNCGPQPPDLVCEFGANEIRHRLVGEHGIEPVRLGPECLQRRAARIESYRLLAELGGYFLCERDQRTLVIDDHYGFTISMRQRSSGLNGRGRNLSRDRKPDLEARAFADLARDINCAAKIADDAVNQG